MGFKKKMLGVLLSVVLACGLMPAAAFAAIGDVPAGESAIGQVHVAIEDMVDRPAEENYPAPKGVIAEGYVDLYPSDTAMSAIARLADEKSISVEGADAGYITSIDGLAAMDCGKMSGWMGTINDWFADSGFDSISVASGNLEPGDDICMMYTLSWGADLGSDWSNNDKSVWDVYQSDGALFPLFCADIHEYTLYVPKGTESVALVPCAVNKNFQVRTSVGATEYKRGAAIPVSDGTSILVKCGDPSWPTMNAAADIPAEEYTFAVKYVPVFADVDYDGAWYGDAVAIVSGKGLMKGYGDSDLFGVGATLTRGELATILWRNACPEEAASYDPTTAVDTTGIAGSADGMFYTAAANWAVANGVITGIERADGSFDFAANEPVSFEQLVTILSRFCATPEEVAAAGKDLSAFADGAEASSWSQGAFAWAAKEGLVSGYDEADGKYLCAGENVARERVAMVLSNAFDLGFLK